MTFRPRHLLLTTAAVALVACAGQPESPGEGAVQDEAPTGEAVPDDPATGDDATDEGDAPEVALDEDPRPAASEELAVIETAFGSTFSYTIAERCDLSDEGAQIGTDQFELGGTIEGDADLDVLVTELEPRVEFVAQQDDGTVQARLTQAGTFTAAADGRAGTVSWTIDDPDDEAYADLEVATCTDRE